MFTSAIRRLILSSVRLHPPGIASGAAPHDRAHLQMSASPVPQGAVRGNAAGIRHAVSAEAEDKAALGRREVQAEDHHCATLQPQGQIRAPG